MSRIIDRSRARGWMAALGLVAASGWASACAEQQPPAEAPSKASEQEKPVAADQPTPEPEEPQDVRTTCIFIVKDDCFSTFEEACKALDCPGGKCEALPSLPPKVACPS